jgi:hypothetical protein
MVVVAGVSALAGSVVQASAYSAFECAAARMRAIASDGPIAEYYARLSEQCGCELGSKIAICEWLQHQKQLDGQQRTKRHGRND